MSKAVKNVWIIVAIVFAAAVGTVSYFALTFEAKIAAEIAKLNADSGQPFLIEHGAIEGKFFDRFAVVHDVVLKNRQTPEDSFVRAERMLLQDFDYFTMPVLPAQVVLENIEAEGPPLAGAGEKVSASTIEIMGFHDNVAAREQGPFMRYAVDRLIMTGAKIVEANGSTMTVGKQTADGVANGVIGQLSIEDVVINEAEEKISAARMAVTQLDVRPFLNDQGFFDPKALEQETLLRALAFEKAGVENMAVDAPKDSMKFNIDSFSASGVADGKVDLISLVGVKGTTKSGALALGDFRVEGLDVALLAELDKDEPDARLVRQALEAFRGISLRELAFTEDKTGHRTALKALVYTVDDDSNVLKTSFNLDGLSISTKLAKNPVVQMLLAKVPEIGDQFVFNARSEGVTDRKAQTHQGGLAVSLEHFLDAKLDLAISSLPDEESFLALAEMGDEAFPLVIDLLKDVKADGLAIDLEIGKAGGLIFEEFAKEKGASREQFARQLSMVGAMMGGQFVGSDRSGDLAQKLLGFLADNEPLSISLKAKEAMSLEEFKYLSAQPQMLAERYDIKF